MVFLSVCRRKVSQVIFCPVCEIRVEAEYGGIVYFTFRNGAKSAKLCLSFKKIQHFSGLQYFKTFIQISYKAEASDFDFEGGMARRISYFLRIFFLSCEKDCHTKFHELGIVGFQF